jgi:ElaB/YqjD/DUF883 family membrane-anchored ribosome-binding protein
MSTPTSEMSTANRDKLVQDFNTVISDTEQLLKSMASTGGEKAAALRATVEENLRVARDRLRALEQTALEKGRVAAQYTDEYVRGNPWQSVGYAAGVGLAVGLVLGLLLGRGSGE